MSRHDTMSACLGPCISLSAVPLRYLYFPEGYGEYSGFPGASKKEKWVGGGVHGGAQGSKGGDRKGSKVVTGGREAQGFAGEGNGARRMDTVTRMSHMGLKSISLVSIRYITVQYYTEQYCVASYCSTTLYCIAHSTV